MLISGGGTNLQAILDAEKAGALHSGSVKLVISNRKGAYGLERAKHAGVKAVAVTPYSKYVLLGRTEEAAELDKLMDGVGVVEFGGDSLSVQIQFVHTLLMQTIKVGLAVQLKPHHVAVVVNSLLVF